MGAVINACFNALKASMAYMVSDTWLQLPTGSFPSEILAEGLSNVCEPFDEPAVVAHQTEKSVHLYIVLQQGTFCNCFRVRVAGANPIL